MPLTILMPALSPTMEQGTLAKWLKREGDQVRSGDIIAEIETDKATMEFEAVDEGTIGKILVSDGTENIAVNSPIAVLLEDGETVDDIKNVDLGAREEASGRSDELTADPAPVVDSSSVASPLSVAPSGVLDSQSGGRIIASPLAKRLAKEKGLDLATLQGSGPRGRIIAHDVNEAKVSAKQPEKGLTHQVAHQDLASQEVIKVDGMRKTIAARLVESKQTVPHFYLSVDCDLDKLMTLRKEINEASPEGEGAYKVSVNDFVIKALALSLIKVPAANALWAGDTIIRYHQADVGVAVAVEGGLFTPVVRMADRKSLVMISNEVKDLAGRARQRKLMPEEYQGGVSSVSNLGMYGIKDFSAIINPPQSSILAVGAGEKRAVIRNNEIVSATVMTVTLSCDHRVVDGALGAELLGAFKAYIEAPIRMMIS